MRLGIVGGGQLGRMMAQAGSCLGIEFAFLDPSDQACAASMGQHLRADYGDPEAIEQLAAISDCITFEFENVPPAAVARLASLRPAQPGANCLAVARDRWVEKSLFVQLGIPIAPIRAVDSQAELEAAVAALGLPVICKTRTLGYDGKGQKRLLQPGDVANSFVELGSVPLIVEAMVAFDHEISVLAVRDRQGQILCYPVAENEHRQGILHASTPMVDHPQTQQAQSHARAVMQQLDYVGVMAFEFFVVDSQLLANEIAPRVHNSGHWSIEGAVCSQFENHVRAVTGLPLGSTELVQPCTMLNIIGARPDYQQLLALPGVHVHDYGKSARAGRKIGHVTVCAADTRRLAELVEQVEWLLVNQLD